MECGFVDIGVCVVDVQRREIGQPRHLAGIGEGRAAGRVALHVAEPSDPGRDRAARRQSLDVPLPGPRQRLVEVVDVEGEAAFRGGVGAEVQEVRVAAGLDVETGHRRVREIRRHDDGRAPQESERRLEHPRVAHGHQIRQPGGVRLLEQFDGIGSIRREGRARRDSTAEPAAARRDPPRRVPHGCAHPDR